jgi:hypothetical protein
MTRWIAVFGCAFAVTLVAAAGFDAHAQKKATSTACVATAMDGKQTKWRCKAGQKCCFSWLSNKGTCIAASDLCVF